jgi:hypothetical protein
MDTDMDRDRDIPVLSPIENFWSILGMQLNEQKSNPTSILDLEKCPTKAWKKILTRSSKTNLPNARQS